MRSFRRYWLEIGLTAIGCAIAARFLAPTPAPSESKQEPPKKPGQTKSSRSIQPARPDPPPKALSIWNIDQVTPGMTYDQVLRLLGPPSQFKVQGNGWTCLYWREQHTVYFQRGIAFACFGHQLCKGSEPIKASAKDLPALKKILGKGRKSDWVTEWWWPDIQVGCTYRGRFVQVAPSIGEPSLENENSWQYPWSSDLNERMSLDGVVLGGRLHANQNNPQVKLSRSGYIVAVTGREFRYDANLGEHNLSKEPVRVGEPVEKIKNWAPPGASLERFRCWDGRLEVESGGGKITSLKMSLEEPDLIRVLDQQAQNR